MLTSPAWQDLSPIAHDLYIYCKDQHGYTPPNVTGDGKANKDYFVMNREKWQEHYKACASPNAFIKAMRELVTHGFVEVYQNGKNTRTSTIYRFTSKWKDWTKENGVDLNGASKAFMTIHRRPKKPRGEKDAEAESADSS